MYGTPGLACPAFYGFLNEDDHADHGHGQVLFQKPLLIFDLLFQCLWWMSFRIQLQQPAMTSSPCCKYII